MFNDSGKEASKDLSKWQFYETSSNLTKSQRFSNISLGYGKKFDFVKNVAQNPGPGAYEMTDFLQEKLKNTMRDRKKKQLHKIASIAGLEQK